MAYLTSTAAPLDVYTSASPHIAAWAFQVFEDLLARRDHTNPP